MNVLQALLTEDFFSATIRMAAPIILAAEGEVLLERAGIFNLGVEAGILLGAFFGVLGSYLTGSAWLGVLVAILAGLERGHIYPTRNLETVAAECAGIRHVTAREPTAARTFLKNSFAFGGIHASLVCRRWTEGDPA